MTILIYIVVLAGLITTAFVIYLCFRGGFRYDNFDDAPDEVEANNE